MPGVNYCMKNSLVGSVRTTSPMQKGNAVLRLHALFVAHYLCFAKYLILKPMHQRSGFELNMVYDIYSCFKHSVGFTLAALTV